MDPLVPGKKVLLECESTFQAEPWARIVLGRKWVEIQI